jgi:transcription termination factor Rho
MSVESTTLERSALERKARDELTTIARDLGVKTRTRDRKADIVDAILESTAGASGGGAPGTASKGAPPGGHTVGTSSAADGTDQRDQGGPSPVAETNDDRNGGPVPEAPAARPGLEPTVERGAAQREPAPAAVPTGEPSTGKAGSEGSKDTVTDKTSTEGRPAEQTSASTVPATPQNGHENGSDTSGSAAAERSGKPDRSESGGKADRTERPGQAEDSGSGEGAEKSGKADRSEKSDGGEGRQDRDRQGGGRNQGQGGQGQNRQREQRNGQQRGGGGGAQQDSESGNRRRRRRGRNRGDSPQPEEYTGEPIEVSGYLDLRDEGYGFLRVKGTRPSKEDIYVSVKQARQFGLRKGDHITGASRPALRNEKNPALLRIDEVNGRDPEKAKNRRKFGDLTPLFPDEKLSLELADDPGNMTARIIDLISPIGKGQRGLIVSPPKAGKTTIIKQIVRSIEVNNPEVKLLVLQVDERPEEVTDMRRWLRNPESEVAASTFDRPADEHAHVAELTIERAKRMVEDGRDVCIVLDGITRLARAYNLAAPATGRIMSGGVDSGALYPPKKFFGAARNVEEGGSLTILATALVETGSKMDEVIFEEFKGTGNMELRLDRRLSERRIYPAIDVDASSTRHEELLFPRNQLNLVWALRRVLSGLSSSDGGNAAALELLTDRMKTFRSNDEFLSEVAKNRLAAAG